MPVQYPQVMAQMRKKLEQARRSRQALAERLKEAREAFAAWAGAEKYETLARRVEKAMSQDQTLRCALPLEPLDRVTPPPREPAQEALVVLASDGSHIMPDAHRPVYFGLVNAAVLALAYDRAAKRVESRLFLEDDFPLETSPEAHVRLARIEAEYEIVTRAAVWLRTGQDAPEGWFTLREGEQAVALVDGPLELWGIPERGGVAYKTQVQRMTRLWGRLRGAGVPLAGYVDRPRADLVVRALAVARPDWEKGAAYPWPGVLDRHLYGPLLQPGWRSPVFAIWTEGMKSYPEEQRVHFFYMHVGGEEQPGLARVEIPAWVAQHPAWVDLIHRALWVHLQQSGRGRYPYALHRAHQEAVVTYKEREELETLLVRETVRLGLPVPGFSAKQRLKEQDRRPR